MDKSQKTNPPGTNNTHSSKCVIYCRISTPNQMTGHSLQNQESTIKTFAINNKFKVTSIIKDIGSAYLSNPGELSKLASAMNTNILIFSVDRFSRNLDEGTLMARKFINNGNTLYFIREEFFINVCVGKSWDKFITYLRGAENESKTISTRMKSIKKYAQENGIYVGGSVPYGMKVKRENNVSRLVVDEKNKNIIKLILAARRGNTSIAKLGEYLKNHGADIDNFPIKSEKEIIDKGLCFKEIADLLNDYLIEYTNGKKWKNTNVGLTFRRFSKMKEFMCNTESKQVGDQNTESKQVGGADGSNKQVGNVNKNISSADVEDEETQLLIKISKSLVIDWKDEPTTPNTTNTASTANIQTRQAKKRARDKSAGSENMDADGWM